MKIQFKKLGLLAAVALALPSFGIAAPKAPANAKTPEKTADTATATEKPKKTTYPLYGVVVAVTPTLLTIKGGEGKEDRKFTITPDTKIKKEEKPAKISDVKVGQRVGGLLDKKDPANVVVVSLNLTVKEPKSKEEAKAPDATKPADAKPEKAPKKKAA